MLPLGSTRPANAAAAALFCSVFGLPDPCPEVWGLVPVDEWNRLLNHWLVVVTGAVVWLDVEEKVVSDPITMLDKLWADEEASSVFT